MHIERIDAHAFGPLQGDALELGPGCNVVHGPNESGKSTWHAALTTALSGRRRGRGQPAAEREFADRYRPWSGSRWAVGARLRLADGRVVSILQDLDDPSRCQAHDQAGRWVLDEILAEGMPDASRWLGLDRDAFRACASVRQAEVARVGAGAASLQQYLQQAASTRRAESTAGAALDRLRSFKAEAVGTDRRNAVKPLRRATVNLAEAQQSLAAASAAHACLIDATEACAHLGAEADRTTLERRAAEAVEAALVADRLEHEAARIAQLTARCPEAPPALDRDDEQARVVAAAVARWESRPAIAELPVPGAAELRKRLAEPTPSFGDTEVHPSVEEALNDAQRAHHARDFHRESEPPDQPLPAGTEPVELRELARRLRAEPPPPPAPDAATPPSVPVLVCGATVAAAGALALAGQLLAAALVAVGGIALTVVLLRRRSSASVAQTPPADSPVRSRIAQLGLPMEPGALELLADRAARHRVWAEQGQTVRDDARRTAVSAVLAIQARLGTEHDPRASLRDLISTYRASCQRAAQDQRAAAEARGQLELAVARAEAGEQNVAVARTAWVGASEVVRAAAAVAGVEGDDVDLLAEGLVAWQDARRAQLAELQARRDAWDELQRASGGRSLATWNARRDKSRADADALAAEIDPDVLARVRDESVPLADRVAAERAAADQAHAAAAALEVRQAGLSSVAEAAEAVSAAEGELHRVSRLDQVLATTIGCLEEAQDRLYRSLAPVLAERLTEVLPEVTAGRYEEVTVDPETLDVGVRLADGTLRPAGLLSHGTAEQIYLLLRVAMAERLVAGGESCPLVLDDVTVHCDPERTLAILDLLARLAEDRQVVLFTQEADVVTWAERALVGDRHRVIALERPAVPA